MATRDRASPKQPATPTQEQLTSFFLRKGCRATPAPPVADPNDPNVVVDADEINHAPHEPGDHPACIEYEFSQDCAHEPDPECSSGACARACVEGCNGCQVACGGSCDVCRAACAKDDVVCARACAARRATCFTTCTKNVDRCRTGCHTRASSCWNKTDQRYKKECDGKVCSDYNVCAFGGGERCDTKGLSDWCVERCAMHEN